MDSWEFNKIFGGLLAVLTFTLGLNIVTELLFEVEAPEKAGFSVEVAQATPAAEEAKAEVDTDKPVEVVLASADAARGQNVFKACAACHTAEKGGPNRVGPNLWNVVGNKKAHLEGFKYSKAITEVAAKGEKWGYAELYKFIKNPRAYMPGTAMAYAGIKKAEDRADVIAYLRTLSDSPVPLPK